jgi:RNA recognition motif. (a.k.a. RRM, RBD, or RNP domain)
MEQLQRHSRRALRPLWQVWADQVSTLHTLCRSVALWHYGIGQTPYFFARPGSLTPFSRQIRQGIANNTKGTAYVVYEDVMDAKQACDKLNGFNFQNRYLVGTLRRPP